jgi:hypothetical protein
LFLGGRWLHGQKIQDLAPALFASMPKQIAKKGTVQEALKDLTWVRDIRGSLQAHALLEFLVIWDILQEFHLTPDVADLHHWTPSNSGAYSSKSAYDRFFLGLFSSSCIRGYGRLGLRLGANSLCGGHLSIAAGRLIGTIRYIACYASKRRKPFNTFLFHVYSLGRSGSGCYPWWGYKGALWNRGKKKFKNGGEQQS